MLAESPPCGNAETAYGRDAMVGSVLPVRPSLFMERLRRRGGHRPAVPRPRAKLLQIHDGSRVASYPRGSAWDVLSLRPKTTRAAGPPHSTRRVVR